MTRTAPAQPETIRLRLPMILCRCRKCGAEVWVPDRERLNTVIELPNACGCETGGEWELQLRYPDRDEPVAVVRLEGPRERAMRQHYEARR